MLPVVFCVCIVLFFAFLLVNVHVNGGNSLRVLESFLSLLVFFLLLNDFFYLFFVLCLGPGVVVNLILIGGTMHYFAPLVDPEYDWPWSICFMFGCILAATELSLSCLDRIVIVLHEFVFLI